MSAMFVELSQIRNLYASLGDIVSLFLTDISSFRRTYSLEKFPSKGLLVHIERFWWLLIPMISHV